MKKRRFYRHVNGKYFSISIFALTFLAFALLTTIQNKILGAYIDYTAITPRIIVEMGMYWLIVSASFTIFTRWQIVKNYDKPLQSFAKATRQVANGDFSVYVRPLHTADKADYLDVMFEDFNKMVAELGSIETLKTEFFSNVSHEIKTPLAVIQSNAEMLNVDHLTNAQRTQYADSIVRSTKKLSGLITNILKLNKLEQQAIHPAPEAYDLCGQLIECALLFEDVWEQKEIEFQADLEDRATIEADKSLLEIVWNNLLSNAMKFTGNGGKVTLTQTSTADEITVSVSDTGSGMDESTMKHIFDKFYQGDTSHWAQGNGLGLALCLRIIQLSGGTIAAKSAPGRGSEFTVQLPISSAINEDS